MFSNGVPLPITGRVAAGGVSADVGEDFGSETTSRFVVVMDVNVHVVDVVRVALRVMVGVYIGSVLDPAMIGMMICSASPSPSPSTSTIFCVLVATTLLFDFDFDFVTPF